MVAHEAVGVNTAVRLCFASFWERLASYYFGESTVVSVVFKDLLLVYTPQYGVVDIG